ncbi:GNAT family N-acetyltransferase [Paenibacillus xylanilyticus]|uniref:GNAT family N-acetyltransferase n=1 Tax=Paenibacillus xylanilyticus TaxID=248903 RepID=A0A7Y6BXU4_9BACL|nr:GNAT family protein [Paenibacillus xylanilyticus]NUU76471.1 GNAT family N-acetyltransferase [Paenibacillus xylanilyticus]
MIISETNVLNNKVQIREIEDRDLPVLYELIYGEKQPEWKKWDAPYFPLEHVSFTLFEEHMSKHMRGDDEPANRMIIEVNDEMIGTVNYYWEHKPSNWLEIGIVIYKPPYWNGGYGTAALKLWIEYLFNKIPLVRIGLTTWSGNERMMKVGEKLGMQVEGRLRKCRLYNDQYYDSIRMGILREEWDAK